MNNLSAFSEWSKTGLGYDTGFGLKGEDQLPVYTKVRVVSQACNLSIVQCSDRATRH
jgi:hypothetical protein